MARLLKSLPIVVSAPVNDNEPPGVMVVSAWPWRIAVTVVELNLLETYLGDVVAELLALNDNETD